MTLKSEMAKELANKILNIFKRGLHDSKYFKADGTFSLPLTFYKDVYISGFVQHFISVNLYNSYDKLRTWKKDEIGKFVLDVYKEINLSESDTEFYKKLIIDKETEKNWDAKGSYTLGKTHARLCYISKIPMVLEKEKNSLIAKAKEKVIEEGVIDNEDYDLKMTAAIYELTIYDYLKNKFVNIKNSKVDNGVDKKNKDTPDIINLEPQTLDKTSKIQNAKSINDLPDKYYEEYEERKKKYELENPYPKHGAALYGILFGVGSMMLISVILTLNYIENEFQAVIGGFLIGGIAYFAQNQNEKNHSLKWVNEMNKIEKEIIGKAKYENKQ